MILGLVTIDHWTYYWRVLACLVYLLVGKDDHLLRVQRRVFLVIICLSGHLERASGTGFLTGPCSCAHVYVSVMHVDCRIHVSMLAVYFLYFHCSSLRCRPYSDARGCHCQPGRAWTPRSLPGCDFVCVCVVASFRAGPPARPGTVQLY